MKYSYPCTHCPVSIILVKLNECLLPLNQIKTSNHLFIALRLTITYVENINCIVYFVFGMRSVTEQIVYGQAHCIQIPIWSTTKVLLQHSFFLLIRNVEILKIPFTSLLLHQFWILINSSDPNEAPTDRMPMHINTPKPNQINVRFQLF